MIIAISRGVENQRSVVKLLNHLSKGMISWADNPDLQFQLWEWDTKGPWNEGAIDPYQEKCKCDSKNFRHSEFTTFITATKKFKDTQKTCGGWDKLKLTWRTFSWWEHRLNCQILPSPSISRLIYGGPAVKLPESMKSFRMVPAAAQGHVNDKESISSIALRLWVRLPHHWYLAQPWYQLHPHLPYHLHLWISQPLK